MSAIAMLFAGLILLPAAGLATWVWFAMTQVEEELRSFTGFDGMHFDIGPQAPESPGGTRWPTPG